MSPTNCCSFPNPDCDCANCLDLEELAHNEQFAADDPGPNPFDELYSIWYGEI